MKIIRKILSVALLVVFAVSLTTTSYAASEISIDTVTFMEYVDEYGAKDASLVTVKVDFTILTTSEQITILLTSENIAEISEVTKPKIIYMIQDFTPDSGTYEFSVEKSKIQSATGLDDIDGCTLYVKMGGKNISEMATKTVEYYDPATSIIYGDVTGDDLIDIADAIKILRYDAGYEETIK